MNPFNKAGVFLTFSGGKFVYPFREVGISGMLVAKVVAAKQKSTPRRKMVIFIIESLQEILGLDVENMIYKVKMEIFIEEKGERSVETEN